MREWLTGESWRCPIHFTCLKCTIQWFLVYLWICVAIVIVQSFSHVQLFVTPWTAAHQASLSFTVSWSLLKPMSIELMMPSNLLILCHPLLLLPSIISSIMVFFSESALCIRWSNIGASASILPMNIQGLISFRIDWSDLAV